MEGLRRRKHDRQAVWNRVTIPGDGRISIPDRMFVIPPKRASVSRVGTSLAIRFGDHEEYAMARQGRRLLVGGGKANVPKWARGKVYKPTLQGDRTLVIDILTGQAEVPAPKHNDASDVPLWVWFAATAVLMILSFLGGVISG